MDKHYFSITINNCDGSTDILNFEDCVKAEEYAEKKFGRQLICFCYNDKHHALLERKSGEIPYDRYVHIQAAA